MRKQWLSLGVAGLLMLMSACGKETDQNTGAVPTETVENQDGQVADGGDTKENDGEENVSDGEEKEDSGAEKETDGDTDETENGQEEVPPVEWIVEDRKSVV